MKDRILPIPFSLGPYGVHTESIHTRILDVGGASSNANKHNSSNLLRSNVEVLDPVKYSLMDDDLPDIGEFARSVSSMQLATADIIENVWNDTRRLAVIGGDHSVAIGTGTGIARCQNMSKVGMVFVDSHGDFNTSKISKSKSVTGYPLAVNLGHGDDFFTSPFNKNFLNHAIHIGMRDVDPWEADMIPELPLTIYNTIDVETRGIGAIIQQVSSELKEFDQIWISLDVDVLDPIYLLPGETDVPVPGGMTPRELLAIIYQLSKDPRCKVLEIVQLNEIGRTTPSVVLASRMLELFFGLGYNRYGEMGISS